MRAKDLSKSNNRFAEIEQIAVDGNCIHFTKLSPVAWCDEPVVSEYSSAYLYFVPGQACSIFKLEEISEIAII